MALNENDWRDLLDEALDDLKGLARSSRDKLLDEYAPRLATLASAESSAAAAQEFDDIKVNLRAAGRIAGIKGETVAVKTIRKIVLLAAGIAKKIAVPVA